MSSPVDSERFSEPSTTDGSEARRAPATNGQTIPVPLSAISQQLPANFLAAVDPGNVARTSVNIPADWILPQLAKGRVSITLADLLPLLPESLVRRPVPTGNSQHAIVLPLADLVASLPVDLLQHQDQTEVNLDTPEFAQFPNLIDDLVGSPAAEETAGVEEIRGVAERKAPTSDVHARSTETTSTPVATPTPIEEETSVPRPLAENTAEAIPATHEPLPQPAALQPPPNHNDITVSLRSLVAVMPDQYFVCSRTDLWRRIDLDSRIALPANLVVPQLKVARVRIPLAVAVGLMPRSILASPLPSISDETIPIALQEIVSQLPQHLFNDQAKSSDSLHEIDFSDSEIPTPFAEKNFASATVEMHTPEPAQPEPTPAPREPETAPKPVEVSSGALVEDLPVFAEKSAVAESAAGEPVPAPVVESPATSAEADVEVPATEEPATVKPIAEVAASADEATEQAVVTESPTPIEVPVVATEARAEQPAPVEPQPAEAAAEVVTPAPEATEQSSIAEAPQPVEPAPATPEIVHEAQVPEPPAPTPSAGTTPDQFLVNLNNCTLADLARIEGIGPVLAQRIIEFRNARGGFASIDDLREVHGISRKLLRSLIGPTRRGLNRLLGVEHNEELALQEVVRLTSQLTGVAGCILAMSDGVFLTGQLPPHLDQETISVFAPQLFRKVGRYMKELRAGQVTRLSVFTDQQPISIFRAGEIFLIVIHDNRHFSKALLRRCERISQELAQLCRQRAVV
jgi:competence ComEA-like helix-hairpin-helix protein